MSPRIGIAKIDGRGQILDVRNVTQVVGQYQGIDPPCERCRTRGGAAEMHLHCTRLKVHLHEGPCIVRAGTVFRIATLYFQVCQRRSALMHRDGIDAGVGFMVVKPAPHLVGAGSIHIDRPDDVGRVRTCVVPL